MDQAVKSKEVVAASGGLRLLTFAPKGEAQARIGVVKGDLVVDLAAEARRGKGLSFDPADMVSLIEAGEKGLAEVRAIAGTAGGIKMADIRYLAPIAKPRRNVFCVGWNYLDHFEEGKEKRDAGLKYPDHPVFFTKATNTVAGPYDPIVVDPAVSTMVDWEAELAVIIGRRGRNISEAAALDHVFGYTIINDTSARDIQRGHGGQWFRGKSIDGYGPMGPWIVARGGLDENDLTLVTRVNGVVKQNASTAQLYFKLPRIIAELSLGLTLEAGDIIATGTPSGVGNSMKPPEFLKPGDVMETEISGIGTMRNPIVGP